MSRLKSRLLERLLNEKHKSCGLFILVDPEKTGAESAGSFAAEASLDGVSGFLIGGSTMKDAEFRKTAAAVKKNTPKPVLFFPGTSRQICEYADGVFFISLISGRNPKYLIDEQVRGAGMVLKAGLDPVPVGYMLISSGGEKTEVEKQSNTCALRREDIRTAVDHALAARCMGMDAVYLECGSGANMAVPPEMVKAVKEESGLVVITGGGIKTPEAAAEISEAGSDFIVVGSLFEKNNDQEEIRKILDSLQ
ncbi:MAG: phosphoglycerol geranylgeranyltransferase [Fibrobacterota bacterium]